MKRRKCLALITTILVAGVLLFAGIPTAGSSQAGKPEGSKKYILLVGPYFNPANMQILGGNCEWYWKEAGIAVAASSNPDFGEQIIGPDVTLAVADVAAKPPKRLAIPKTVSSPDPSFDAYAANYQWYWQAIGAAKPRPGLEPEWQLGDYTGSGVKIADIDTGAPSVFDDNGVPIGLHPEFNEYDLSHPELGGIVLFRDSTGNILNLDDAGHGTAVVSTLAAQHRGDGAMRGLAPRATLYCHKIDFNNFMSSALEGWYKAVEFGCQIVNNSWYDVDLPVDRYEDFQVKLPKLFRQAATELNRRGVLIVAAAGNDAINPNIDGGTYFFYWGTWFDNRGGYPAFKLIPQDMPHVIIAGGTGPSDYDPLAPDLSVYAPVPGGHKGRAFNLDRSVNWYIPPDLGGPSWFGSDYGTFLTVVAPMGFNIKDWNMPPRNFLDQLMYLASPWTDLPGEGLHGYWAGTSFSSPITCGVAALAAEAYFRVHGTMPSPTTLASIIKASADDMVGPATDDFWLWNSKTLQFEFQTNVPADKPGKDLRYGYGRVNVVKAVLAAEK